ncbi:exonuclease SbcC [Thermocatellispora tengchongensis]|uniref:Nuclease SbcCD subunit C n=1 Tax=Thermocatellispora tengchongensis TaxID=1073253 RepID=A0A840NRC4_9ACTN|nr:AAA family ATPase [Thermocatellispora tengchongensis]MBB5131174.1 exonuclease SbcC [Thermocatellispora tengchongensis]
MRLHRLTLAAFGSFPGRETVDFDALGEAGLFLIHGPTGAGKTTVLDAVCYALYGQVPGQRDHAKSLRCDHAPPDRGPVVELEVTIRGRRLRITRSPAWLRPKLRGAGQVEEKAKARAEELTGTGSWVTLSTRADETGHLIGGLLGMNADQFQQVAMLPQGDFARFLRSDGDERRVLLERLFSVGLYTAVERWLAEHRTETGRARQALRQAVDAVVNRIHGAAGPLLAGVESTDAGDEPMEWARGLVAVAGERVTRAEQACAHSEADLREARARLEAGRALADRRRRHAEALARRAELDARADERADLEAILDEAARAERVLPLILRAGQRAEAAAKAHRLAADALSRALPLVPGEGDDPPSPEELAALERGRRDEIARLAELRDDERRRDALAGDLEATERDLAALAVREAATAERLAVLPERHREAEERREEAGRAAASVPAAEAAHLAATRALAATRRRDALAAELEAARETLAAALAVLPEPPGDGDAKELRAALAAMERDRRERAAALEALRADEERLSEVRAELARLDAEIDVLAEQEAAARADAAELPVRLAAIHDRLAALRGEAAAIPAAEAARQAAAARLDAAGLRDTLAAEWEAAEQVRREATDRAQELRDRVLALRQARIEGMAGELACSLVSGEPCVVCGSEHHPAPAPPVAAASIAEDEAEAQAAYEEAQAERQAAESDAAVLATRLADAEERAEGAEAGEAAGLLAAAEAELARLEAVAEEAGAAEAEAERAERELERARDRAAELDRALAECTSRRTELRAELDRLTARLESARGGDASVAARRDRLTAEAELFAGAGEWAARVAEVAAAWEEARSAVPDGETAERAAHALAEAERELAALRAAASGHDALAAEAARLAAETDELRRTGRDIDRELTAARARRDQLAAEVARLAARLDAARGEDPTLAARLDRLADEAALLGEAAESANAARASAVEASAAGEEAAAAAAEAGFGSVADARAAVRPREEREVRAERLRELDAEAAAVDALLADPELIAAAAQPPPDLAALAERHDAAERAHGEHVSARDQARARRDQLAALTDELARCQAEWRPAEERHRLARTLAELTSGTSADNAYDMRLSSFVLGERLRQVVDAANDRLDHMSGGRYLLQYDVRNTAGSRKRTGGGLGLRVLDAWTGVDRDPATLSGGESFVTSLALALGLADVVTAESGGTEIGTLFVDEGFGTLDEDTLDGVLDILDALRDGGRAIGIVSHVAELRARIPARLSVTKTPTGSTLSLHVHA